MHTICELSQNEFAGKPDQMLHLQDSDLDSDPLHLSTDLTPFSCRTRNLPLSTVFRSARRKSPTNKGHFLETSGNNRKPSRLPFWPFFDSIFLSLHNKAVTPSPNAYNGDAMLRGAVSDPNKLMDRALLWLHEQEVVTLGKGLSVFRPAITLHLDPKGGNFTVQNFIPLEEHYTEQTIHTHVMATYAEKGLESINDAGRLAEDYFILERDAFMRRWMPGRGTEFRRQATGVTWTTIIAPPFGDRIEPDRSHVTSTGHIAC